jgi:hypothetical protein
MRMRKDIWGPAVIIPAIAVAITVALFLGIAFIMEAIYPWALAFGTALFIVVSGVAWYLAQQSEKEHAANNPDQADHH